MKNYVEQKLTDFKIWLQNSNHRAAVYFASTECFGNKFSH